LISPSKIKTCYVVRLDFNCTTNIAEYEALLLGLRKLKAIQCFGSDRVPRVAT
jgi:ribonuclease HI